jgi:hypothetical protein
LNFHVEKDEIRLLEENNEWLNNLEPIETDLYLGDVISRIYALLLFFMLFVFMPYAFGNILLRNFEDVKSEDMIKKFEPLYENLKLDKHSNLQYFLVFCIRRFLVILIVFVVLADNPSMQLLSFMWLNLFMLLHTGYLKPFNSRLQNRVVLLNEFGIAIISMHLTFFTEWVPDKVMQSNLGWSMIAFISIVTGVNLYLVLYFGCRGLYLLFLRYYRRMKAKSALIIDKLTKKVDDHLLTSSESSSSMSWPEDIADPVLSNGDENEDNK